MVCHRSADVQAKESKLATAIVAANPASHALATGQDWLECNTLSDPRSIDVWAPSFHMPNGLSPRYNGIDRAGVLAAIDTKVRPAQATVLHADQNLAAARSPHWHGLESDVTGASEQSNSGRTLGVHAGLADVCLCQENLRIGRLSNARLHD